MTKIRLFFLRRQLARPIKEEPGVNKIETHPNPFEEFETEGRWNILNLDRNLIYFQIGKEAKMREARQGNGGMERGMGESNKDYKFIKNSLLGQIK